MTLFALLLCVPALVGSLLLFRRYALDAKRGALPPADRPARRKTPADRADSAQSGAPASSASGSARLRFPPAHKLTRRDAVAALAITLAYAVVAFAALGSSAAPQTFYRFNAICPDLILDLGDTYDLSGITYYTGSFHDRSSGDRHLGYYLELSADGTTYTPYGILNQTHANTFHWMEREFTPEDTAEFAAAPTARRIRIYAQNFPMELGELFVLDSSGEIIDPANYTVSLDGGATFAPISSYPTAPADDQLDTPTFDSPAQLFDEQSLFAADQTYMNSMYFDEIYHGRTAREYLLEENVYENTHPPLGKSIISLGITLFGMTPLGWRFMGTLFGVLMVPFAYAFIKNLFGKTWLAVCGTLIFAFEFMHFTQTRIATIDTYGLFFTILMYFFMYRFLAAGYDAPARQRLIPLALCGISFGCGIASKWTCFYAAAGLVILYIISAVTEGRRLAAENRLGEFFRKFAVVVGVSFVFFVGVSGLIYYLSYLPFAAGNGNELSLETVWQNQQSMFSYHSGLSATHTYQSSWWMWLLDVRPILYVFKSFSNGTTSVLTSLNTPIVSWTGLAALTALTASLYRRADRRTKITGTTFGAIAAASVAAQLLTYTITYAIADAQSLDLVEDVAYTNHPFSFVFAVAAVCAVITPFLTAPRPRPHAAPSAPQQGRGSQQSCEPDVRAGSAAETPAHAPDRHTVADKLAPARAHVPPADAGAAPHPAPQRLPSRLRPLLPIALFALATVGIFAFQLINYDPESTSLVAATDTPLGYTVAALTCAAIAVYVPLRARAAERRRTSAASSGGTASAEAGSPNSAASRPAPRASTAAGADNSLHLPPAARADGSRNLFLIIGYLSQLLAWIPITRNTFAYHYFPSSFFLILALCAMFDHWSDLDLPARRGKRTKPITNKLLLAWRALPTGKRAAYAFTAACLALFALFYPYLSGAPVPRDYLFTFLRWFPSWPM